MQDAEAIFEGLTRGLSWSRGLLVKRGDGTRFPVYVTDSPMFSPHGQLEAIIAVSVDITDRLAADDLRRQLGVENRRRR